MHPQIQKLVDKLQWHASVEEETLDEEFCESLNPRQILLSARRAGLSFEDARKDIITLREAKIADSGDLHGQPLLARSAFRLFSAAVWSAFKEVRWSGHSLVWLAKHSFCNSNVTLRCFHGLCIPFICSSSWHTSCLGHRVTCQEKERPARFAGRQ